MTEEDDSEEKIRDGEKVPPPQLEKVPGSGPCQPTSVHTRNGVTTDGRLVSLKLASSGSKSQSSRTKKEVTGNWKVAQDGVQAELTQDGLKRLTRQTPTSAATGQSAPGADRRSAAGPRKPETTHLGEATGQSAPGVGQRPTVGQQRPERTHKGEATGPDVPVVGKRPTADPERSNSTYTCEARGQSEPGLRVKSADGLYRPVFTHRGEPPGVNASPTSRNSADLDRSQWTACTTQPLDRPFGPSYFIPGKIEGKPVLCLLDTGCTTNLIGKHVFDRLQKGCWVNW